MFRGEGECKPKDWFMIILMVKLNCLTFFQEGGESGEGTTAEVIKTQVRTIW